MIIMKKAVLVILFVLGFFAAAVLAWEFGDGITGRVILDDYSYTRAICEGLVCSDYVVSCDGDEFVGMVIVEGSEIWHDEGWVDFRVEGSLC